MKPRSSPDLGCFEQADAGIELRKLTEVKHVLCALSMLVDGPLPCFQNANHVDDLC